MILSDSWLGSRGTPTSAVGEFGLITRLAEIVEEVTDGRRLRSSYVAIGIGDDTASLRPNPGRETLVTCDTQIADRHFLPDLISPRDLGARCATVNLSDIGAMGGIPRAAVVSLAIGPEPAVEDIEDLYRGMLDRLSEYGAVLVGGNISGLATGLLVDITMIGEVEAGRAVRRDGGQAEDLIWVTGFPGSAAAGLELLRPGRPSAPAEEFRRLFDAHRAPVPRVREGRALGLAQAVSSMIDISDGLLGDLHHLVDGREVGILVREESLPIDDALKQAALELGRSPLSIVLGASDDYELIFTTTAADAERALRAIGEASAVGVWPIGEVVAGPAGQVLLQDHRGRIRPASPRGWDHLIDHTGGVEPST